MPIIEQRVDQVMTIAKDTLVDIMKRYPEPNFEEALGHMVGIVALGVLLVRRLPPNKQLMVMAAADALVASFERQFGKLLDDLIKEEGEKS